MPSSTLYDSTRKTLATHLRDALDTQLDTLALVVVAITQSVSAQLAAIARAMPLTTTQDGKEQRVRRLLDNERITRHNHFHPVARHALSGLKGQRVNLLIDRVLLRDTHGVASNGSTVCSNSVWVGRSIWAVSREPYPRFSLCICNRADRH